MNLVRWSVSWLLYGLGDLASKIMLLNDNSELWVSVWYPIYNNLMHWSTCAQGSGDSGPWASDNNIEMEDIEITED